MARSWGNGGTLNIENMDSNGQFLLIRDATGTEETTPEWRLEARDRSTNAKALKVDGKAKFVRQGTQQGTPTERDCGIVTGALVNQGQSTETGELHINADSNSDPNVQIGCGGDISAGNKVTIMGKHIHIGNTADEQFYRVAIGGPAVVTGNGNLRVASILEADTETQTPRVEPVAAGSPLDLGTRQSSTVNIGRATLLTSIYGRLSVGGFTEMRDGLLVSGGNIATNGTIETQSDITAQGNIIAAQGNLSVQTGYAIVQGDITSRNTVTGVHVNASQSVNAADVNASHEITAPRIVATEGLVSEISIECVDAASFSANGCSTVVPTSVRTDNETLPSLLVEHLREGNHEAALRAINQSEAEDAMGGYFHAPIAVVAEGDVHVEGNTEMNGSLDMRDQPIIMGGEGGNEVRMIASNGRMEIYIGGELRFYVDQEGGHNA